MKNIDPKSLLIGILSTALVAVIIGAGPQQPPAAHRYQFMMSGTAMMVYDNQTDEVSLVAQRNGEGNHFAWFNEDQFSLHDALTKPTGGVIHAGPGQLKE